MEYNYYFIIVLFGCVNSNAQSGLILTWHIVEDNESAHIPSLSSVVFT